MPKRKSETAAGETSPSKVYSTRARASGKATAADTSPPKKARTTGGKRGRPKKSDKEEPTKTEESRAQPPTAGAEESAGETKTEDTTTKTQDQDTTTAAATAAATATAPTTDTKTDEHHKHAEAQILEKGFIYFFYRPKVELEEVSDLKDVQRLYIVLWPQGRIFSKGVPEDQVKQSPKRVIIVPKKQLPELNKHERYWAMVDLVSHDLENVDEGLAEKVYTTKTRGVRDLKGARPCGEGIYAIVEHHGHSHLAYVLEMPHELGDVQKAFHIHKEGSFIMTVKNPNAPHPTIQTFRKESEKPDYPEEIMKEFGNKQWIPAKPVDILNYEGTQLLFIGITEDITKELGEIGKELERMEKIDEKRLTDDKLFKELHMNKSEHPPEPLIKGEWK